MAHATAHYHPPKTPPRQLRVIPGYGGGPPSSATPPPPISNAQLGMLVFIAFESMIFVGLLTAYWILRAGSMSWPPPNQPRLPLAVTGLNTAVLLLSAFAMTRAAAAARRADLDALRTALLATAVLGAGFVAVQGTEWVRLIHQGMTMSSGVYGATFYTLIGLHALHVFGAVVWLAVEVVLVQRRPFSARRQAEVGICATYWYFVCALWLLLFVAVYLR